MTETCGVCYEDISNLIKCNHCVWTSCISCNSKLRKCPYCRREKESMSLTQYKETVNSPVSYRVYRTYLSRHNLAPRLVPIPNTPAIDPELFNDPDNRMFAASMASYR